MNTSTNFDRPEYEDVERIPLLKLIPHAVLRLLDVGCNRGAFGAAIKRRQSTEVWGVEPDAESARVAEARLDKVIVDFFSPSAQLPPRHFDLVCFNDSLEHMPDPAAALKLAREVLAQNGKVLCCVPNMRHIESVEHLILDADWQYEDFGVRDKTHLRFFTRKSLVRLFTQCGYSIERVEFINDDWWDPSRRLRRLIFKIFPKFTYEMRFKQVVVIASVAK